MTTAVIGVTARNVGMFALLVGVGIGVVLLAHALRSREPRAHLVR